MGLIKTPEAYQDDDMMRFVLAVGPECDPQISVGNVAVVGPGNEPRNLEDGTNRVVVDERAVLAVIEGISLPQGPR